MEKAFPTSEIKQTAEECSLDTVLGIGTDVRWIRCLALGQMEKWKCGRWYVCNHLRQTNSNSQSQHCGSLCSCTL